MLGQVIDMVFDVFERFGDFIKEFDETQNDQFILFRKLKQAHQGGINGGRDHRCNMEFE